MNRTTVRTAARNVAAAAIAALFVAACMEGRQAQDPSQQQQYDPNNPYAQPQPSAYDPNAYAQQNPYGQPGMQGQPGAYPQGTAPQQGYPSSPGQLPQNQPAAAAPASPLALPCQNDLICGTHKCNLTTQRCAFPCTANTDCAAGFTCMGAGGPTALCVPGAQ